MSFDGIMLVIATDNRREGLRFVLNVYLDQCPKWCLVTDDPKVIRAIPDGMPCIGRIADWRRRHEAREQAIAFAHLKNGVAALEGERATTDVAPVETVFKAQAVGKSTQTAGGSKWR